MKKVKCANGHFFDAEKFESCPLCGEKAAETAGAISRKEPEHISKTEPLVSKRGSFFQHFMKESEKQIRIPECRILRKRKGIQSTMIPEIRLTIIFRRYAA